MSSEAEGRATQWLRGAGRRLRVESLFLLIDSGRGERRGNEVRGESAAEMRPR